MQGFYYVPVPLGAKKSTASGSAAQGSSSSSSHPPIASADPSKRPRVNVPLMKGRAPAASSGSNTSSSVAPGYMNFNPMNMNHHLNTMSMNIQMNHHHHHHASSLINSSVTSGSSLSSSSTHKTTTPSAAPMHNSSSAGVVPHHLPSKTSQSSAHMAGKQPTTTSSSPSKNTTHHSSSPQQHSQNPIISNGQGPNFTGLWHLNRDKSDSVNNYLEAMGLPSIARQAADKLDLAVIIHQTPSDVTITRKTRIFTDTKTLTFGQEMLIKNVPMRMTVSPTALKTVTQLPQVRGVLVDTRTLEMDGTMMHVVLELTLPEKPPTMVHRYFDKVSESTSLDIDEALYNTLYTPPSEVKRKR